MKSAIKLLVNLGIAPSGSQKRQPAVASNRTQERLRPLAGTRWKQQTKDKQHEGRKA